MRTTYISLLPILFQYQKHTYFDVTSGNLANFGSEKIHQYKILYKQSYFIKEMENGRPVFI